MPKFDADGKPIIEGQAGAGAGEGGKGGEGGQAGAGAGEGGQAGAGEGGKGGEGGQAGAGEGGQGAGKGKEGGEGGQGGDGGAGAGAGEGDDKQFETLTFAEGAKISEPIKKEFVDYCKSEGIKPKSAQGLIEIQAKMNADVAKGQEALRTTAIEGWRTQVKQKYGVELEQKLAIGMKALQTFGSKDLIEMLGDKGENGTGLLNHPAVVEFIVNVGEKLQNDKFIPGGQGSKDLKDRTEKEKADSMYGDTMK